MTGNQKIASRPGELAESGPRLSGAFFWLNAFYVIYCIRPEDWIPGLAYIPLVKITGAIAVLALLASLGRTRRKFRDLPRESNYLLALVSLLFLSAFLSPVWKGGAIGNTLDFAKVWIVWILTFMLLTDFAKLRRIIYIQAASVAVVSVLSLVLGRNQSRLEGVLGGIYSNPNDLALSIVVTLPFALAFLLTAKKTVIRLCWTAAILIMALALFRTASRAGFISLVISGTVCLWYFGVKGRRFYLIVTSAFALAILLIVTGGPLIARMAAIGGNVSTKQEAQAYGSAEERKFLLEKAIEGIEHYPILGIGVRNFETYSGIWKEVHMTYLQIAVEGGIPSLILYLLFFGRAFRNLSRLRRRDLDVPKRIFVDALHGSMIAFVVGGLFAPVAYQFFPYFSVAYTSAFLAMEQEGEAVSGTSSSGRHWLSRYERKGVSAKSKDSVYVSGGRR